MNQFLAKVSIERMQDCGRRSAHRSRRGPRGRLSRLSAAGNERVRVWMFASSCDQSDLIVLKTIAHAMSLSNP